MRHLLILLASTLTACAVPAGEATNDAPASSEPAPEPSCLYESRSIISCPGVGRSDSGFQPACGTCSRLNDESEYSYPCTYQYNYREVQQIEGTCGEYSTAHPEWVAKVERSQRLAACGFTREKTCNEASYKCDCGQVCVYEHSWSGTCKLPCRWSVECSKQTEGQLTRCIGGYCQS